MGHSAHSDRISKYMVHESVNLISFSASFLPEALLAYGYCHCLRLCVCVCVSVCLCVNFCLSGDNSSPFKLGSPNVNQKMQNILFKVPIALGAG